MGVAQVAETLGKTESLRTEQFGSIDGSGKGQQLFEVFGSLRTEQFGSIDGGAVMSIDVSANRAIWIPCRRSTRIHGETRTGRLCEQSNLDPLQGRGV